ncbi:MAG: Crp/Fnr family transcriptional regulator [Phenylobacterium sp.]|uniref:Crp/Fnr family transcriptional regulator n=1 Tax=Phenylobacterium sp. TaxID=1871053 RepID=UPI00391D1CB4
MTLSPPPPHLVNNLLAVLKPADAAALNEHLTAQETAGGEVLFEQGETVRYAYFPTGATMVSFVVSVDGGRGIETALIGREGAVGGIVSQGRLPAYCRAVVQNRGGPLLRIETVQLEAAKARSPSLRHLFARYADCLLAQVFQSVACNAAHTIEERASKWLAAAVERTGATSITMTQDELASLLGVGRSYMSQFLKSLKARGLVETGRGRIKVLSPAGLSRLSCNCNELVKAHFDEVLAGVYPDKDA